jgi:hypothetical protein
MSRYEIRGSSEPPHKLVLGHDPMLASFFAQVFKKGRPGPVLWLGAAEIITDVEDLRTALEPYGGISVSVCADLLRDQAIDQERPFPETLAALIALTHREPVTAAQTELAEALTYYLFLDQSGCNVRDFASLPVPHADRDEAFRKLIYGEQSPLPAHVEMVTGYFRSSSLLLLIDEYGVGKHLPLYFALPRRGGAYPGPVGPAIITYLETGIPAEQVRRILSEDLFVLDPSVQAQATELYYRSPLSRLTVL